MAKIGLFIVIGFWWRTASACNAAAPGEQARSLPSKRLCP